MMRTAIVVGLALGLVLSPAGAAPDVPGGAFLKPDKVKHGAPLAPAGFTVVGKKSRVTRFTAPAPYGPAVALAPDAALEATLSVPAPRLPKKVAPAGWYGVVSLDLVGITKSGLGELTLEVRVGEKRKPVAQVTVEVSHRARKAAKSNETVAAIHRHRAWLKIPSKVIHALEGKPLTLTIRADGARRVVIDDVRFDMFHDTPTRPLVGKPNGKNGPDLLASGALGFLALTEHMKTAFSFLEIREGGPTARAGITHGDLVVAVDLEPLAPSSLAAGEAWFRTSHEATLGRAIERALDEGRTTIELTVLRDKGTKTIKVRLPYRAGFGASFPYADALTEKLRADVIDWVAGNQKKDGFWPGNKAVNSCLAGLALLGTRKRKYKQALRALVDGLLKAHPTAKEVGGFSYWAIGFQGIFFCEYYFATEDKRVLRWIEDAIQWLPSTTHPSKWGMQAFGHSPKGLPYGEKALMAPCSHLIVFEALATRCGVESKVWDHIKPYVIHSWSDPKEKKGHGGMGYNASYKDKAQFWSRTGLTALALHIRGHERRMKKALTDFMVLRHPYMLNSHAYGEPGAALGLAALATVDPRGFAKVMPQWRWRFLCAWEPGFGLRYSSPHMGSPYMGEEEIVNPAYGMLFSVLNKGLVITGGEPTRWLR